MEYLIDLVLFCQLGMGNRVPGGDGGGDDGGSGGGGGLRRPSDVRDFFRRRGKRSNPPSHHLHDPSQHPLPPPASSSSAYNHNRDKINSCPDLVRPDTRPLHRSKAEGDEDEDPPIGLKIYRSYSDIPDSKMSSCSEIPTIEVRVYRRSTEGLASSAGKAVSLPRGMERSLGATSVMSYGSDFRPSPRDCTSAIETRSSRRGSSRCSMASIGYRGG